MQIVIRQEPIHKRPFLRVCPWYMRVTPLLLRFRELCAERERVLGSRSAAVRWWAELVGLC